jgi:hypothetical protein
MAGLLVVALLLFLGGGNYPSFPDNPERGLLMESTPLPI